MKPKIDDQELYDLATAIEESDEVKIGPGGWYPDTRPASITAHTRSHEAWACGDTAAARVPQEH